MNVVVTGGGTIAPIDDVRHITNVSIGPLLGGDHRGLPGARGDGLAHPRPLGAAPVPPAAPGST